MKELTPPLCNCGLPMARLYNPYRKEWYWAPDCICCTVDVRTAELLQSAKHSVRKTLTVAHGYPPNEDVVNTVAEKLAASIPMAGERLDWDATAEAPKAKASGRIRAKLNYKGRSKPIVESR